MRRLLLTVAVAMTILAGLSLRAMGQQGWSQAQSISGGNGPATINALSYDGDVLWIVGSDGLIVRSEDDGQTFQKQSVRVNAGLNDVFCLRDKVWIVGDQGTVLFSTDRGQSFVKNLFTQFGRSRSGGSNGQVTRDHVDLYSVQFLDRNHGYIVGDKGLILESDDGGVTWNELSSGTTSQLFHLSFRGKKGWAVGTGGVVISTRDGGRTWEPGQSGTTVDLNRIVMVSDDTGFISGDKGTLLRTEDGGRSWSPVSTGVSEPLFGMSFTDRKTGWVVGYHGTIIRTYDGGRSFVEQESHTQTDLFAVSFFRHRGFAIGREGLVLRYFEKR